MLREKPALIVGSPACTAFSCLQNLSKNRGDENKKKELMKEAVAHLEFCCALYHHQVSQGRYFLHEHPLTATPWQLQCVREVLVLEGVQAVTAHQCMLGLRAMTSEGPKHAMKPTRFLTNSSCLAKRLEARCDGSHQHTPCQGNLTKEIEKYIGYTLLSRASAF